MECQTVDEIDLHCKKNVKKMLTSACTPIVGFRPGTVVGPFEWSKAHWKKQAGTNSDCERFRTICGFLFRILWECGFV